MVFKVITAVFNAGYFFERCAESIKAQEWDHFDVVVVDDASTDGTADRVRQVCDDNGWTGILQQVNRGALHSQVTGIRALNCEPDDVLVFVDGDDRLAHQHVFRTLDQYYKDGAKLTFGQYQPDPPSSTCTLAARIPDQVIEDGNFRDIAALGGYIWWNHLRTFKYELFAQLTDDDFVDASGQFYKTATDAALMFPCLELARPHIQFIPETLYLYTSDNRISDWRRWPHQCDDDHRHILGRAAKR